ncbi:MAG: PAS domain S-box protein [Planctomycetes bacterium]|nr:PAS domain S-box protein [Planctomycetota bacterium]
MKTNSIRTILAILLAVFSFTATTCHGDVEDPLTTEERAWLNENNGKIRLGPDPHAPPLDFFDESGHYKGLTADYVRLIEKKLGFRFEIVRMGAWDDLLKSAKKKEIDVICAAKWTPERDKYLLFTKPFIHIPEVIITRETFKKSVSIEELRNIKVTMVEGYAVFEIVSKRYPWLDIETSKNDLDGLLKVSFNRCDAMIIDLTMASYLIEKEGIGNLRVAGYSDIVIDLGFASLKDIPILNSILEKGLALVTEQERKSIYSTWIHLEVKHFYASRRFWLIISGILGIPSIVIVIILVWNRTLRHLVEQRTAKLEESNVLLRAGEKQIHKLSHAVRHSSATIIITDTEGNIEYANPMFTQLTGYSIEEAIGNNPHVLQSGKTPPEVYEELWSTIKSGDEWKGELCNKKKEGELYWEQVSISPVKDDKGAITNFIAVKDDITERKQTEEALKQSEQRLRDLLDYSSAIIFMKDLSGKYLFINRRYELMFNIKNKDIVSKTDHDIFPKEMADTFRSHDIHVVEKGGLVEVEESALHDDGEVHIYLSVKFPVRRASGEIYATCGIATDITERKKLEVELKQTTAMLTNVLDSTPDMIFVKDMELRTIMCNKYFAAAVGKKPEDLLGKTDIENGWNPELVQGNPDKGIRGFENDDREALSGRTIHNPADLANVGDKVLVFDTKKIPLYDSDGSVIGVLGVARDVTDRNKMEEALLQSEKLKSIGTITAGISHEFNNLLAIISGNVQILKEVYKDDKVLTDALSTIMKAADDGAEISSNMLKFTKTRSDTKEFVSSDIKGLIMHSIAFTKPRWKNEAQARGINYYTHHELVLGISGQEFA